MSREGRLGHARSEPVQGSALATCSEWPATPRPRVQVGEILAPPPGLRQADGDLAGALVWIDPKPGTLALVMDEGGFIADRP